MAKIKGIYIKIEGETRFLMVDTGASISIIKREKIPIRSNIDRTYNVNINGIVGNVKIEGKISADLEIKNVNVKHEFIIMDNFKSNFDGILGMDFIDKYKAVINNEESLIIIDVEGQKYSNKLFEEKVFTMKIPPRCETIQYFRVNETEDCVIAGEEITPGVVVANMIVKPVNGTIPVRIMNVTSDEKEIKEYKPKIEKLTDFKLATFAGEKQDVKRVEEVLKKLDLKHLNEEEKEDIQRICGKYADIFYLEGDKLTTTNVLNQKIYLKPESTPVFVKPYRLPHTQKEEINKQVKKMIEDGIAEEACSEWSSPLLLVPKKLDRDGNKKYRVVIDYRKVNERIQDDKFPLPCITDILDSLGGAIYFSHLDMSQGYYQVPLEENSRNITAFSTDRGQFRLSRLPMGLKISPSAFSRLMTVAMSGLNYINCFIYLDDIIIFGKNLKEHNRNLIQVFERLRQSNLKLNPLKCEFLCKQINYLGHMISSEGIAPDPEKIKVLKEYPVPKDAKEAKRFTAFANYYRRHIQNFSQIAKPLHNLNKKNVEFNWTKECQNAFDILKTKLTTAPVLDFPNFDPSNEFILRTDASGYAIGAVLSNSTDKPVAYASRSLNSAEKNYCTVEKELLAIVWATKHFRPYLFGRKFKILTDHKPLVYLFGMSNPSSRLMKFRIALEEYDFVVEYVKGSSNVTADALSRITLNELKELNQNVINVITRSMTKKLQNSKSKDEHVEQDTPKIVELLKKPKNVPELKIELEETDDKNNDKNNNEIAINLKNNTLYVKSQKSTLNLTSLLKELDIFCQENTIKKILLMKDEGTKELINKLKNKKYSNELKYVKVIVLSKPKEIHDLKEKLIILNDFHMLPTGGHAGINRMYRNVCRKFIWKNLKEDIKKFIKNCRECQTCKHSKYTREPMVITNTPKSVFERITLDLVGPLPEDDFENKYILTIQDELSKFVEGYPIKSKDSFSVAKSFVQNFVLRYGVPKEILTDRGKEFMSELFRNVCIALNIEKNNSVAYHHQTLGSLENTHKNLHEFLRMKVKSLHKSWSEWVAYWCFAFNTTVHSSSGYTPYEVVFGKKCRVPSNLQLENELEVFGDYVEEMKYRIVQAENEVTENLNRSKEIRKLKYDAKLNQRKYLPNHKILIKKEVGNKMTPLYEGPYDVIIDINPNVIVKKNNKVEVVHKNRTKLFNQ